MVRPDGIPEDDLDPTRPIEMDGDHLVYWLWSQDGKKVRMTCQDTPHYRRFVVWLRKFDRWHENGGVTS
jgi:hypothetical protein